jgi:PPOX class probable F420-dependent enzyme
VEAGTLENLPPWALSLLAEARVGHLGLLDGEGEPRVLPVTYARVGEELWSAVDHKPKRVPGTELARVRWLRESPPAALTVDRYDDDWSRLAWVQVLGRVAVVERPPPAVLDALAARYAPYRERAPRGPWLQLVPERVLWWRAADTT